jgi:predicted Rossmann fold flavoprotein
MNGKRVAVVGAGAAGVFAAISCVESFPDAMVSVFEKGSKLLRKVKISGGGRCNVTHSCFDPSELVKHYPRGHRELLGPFYYWQPQDMVDWLLDKGVELKTEADGRMFPVTNDSMTIVRCLIDTAHDLGVSIKTHQEVHSLEHQDGSYTLTVGKNKTTEVYDAVILTTGGGAASGGLKIAEKLGHRITPLVPSLFTFDVEDERLSGLAGVSVKNAQVALVDAKSAATGPLLITHWGLSGPAVLKLSAWAARELSQTNYNFIASVNWLGMSSGAVEESLDSARENSGAKTCLQHCPFELPKRLWDRLLSASGIDSHQTWAQLPKALSSTLIDQLTDARFQVDGKSTNKDEFVTCGGVALDEVNFKTMESRLSKNLFFAGEILDIDGVTGGFNFQAAWTTARIAGASAGKSC